MGGAPNTPKMKSQQPCFKWWQHVAGQNQRCHFRTYSETWDRWGYDLAFDPWQLHIFLVSFSRAQLIGLSRPRFLPHPPSPRPRTAAPCPPTEDRGKALNENPVAAKRTEENQKAKRKRKPKAWFRGAYFNTVGQKENQRLGSVEPFQYC